MYSLLPPSGSLTLALRARLTSTVLAGLVAIPSVSAPGYLDRPCGFDLNDNGIRGEAEDCQVCDGSTLDPDFDGINEDLIYVDCDSGTDSGSCGAPGAPCRTLEFALNVRADGPGDGAEDIVCFRGTCSPSELEPAIRGVSGHYEVPATGSQERSFQYPSNPAMIVGWDSDRDADYPPHDVDDTAVLDGSVGQPSRAFNINHSADNSFFEIAHFEAVNYNVAPGNDIGGFMRPNNGRQASHLYVHDIALRDINAGQTNRSGAIAFHLFGVGGLRYLAIENIRGTGIGSYFARGSGGDSPPGAGPIRFQNLSIKGHGCDTEDCGDLARFTAFKFWGYIQEVEILDSSFDCDVDSWDPFICVGVGPAQCAQDVTVRGNEFIDFTVALGVQGSARGFCEGSVARATDDIVYDRNLIRNSFSGFTPDHIYMDPGDGADDPGEWTEDVTFSNNIITSSVPYRSCFRYVGGHRAQENPGTITFINNTCHGPITDKPGSGAFLLDRGSPFPHQDWVFRNNIISGVEENQLNVQLGFLPHSWSANFNVYSPFGNFQIPSLRLPDLASWRRETGADGRSTRCQPLFVDAANNDLHLRFDDTCARDNGERLSPRAHDVDGEERQSPWDIGADEVRVPESSALDVLSGRFRLGVQFVDANVARVATSRPLTAASGYFWFFEPDNVEVLVKMIDACSLTDRFWLFATGLTNVGTALRVEDLSASSSRTYLTLGGAAFPPILDTAAFDGCGG